MNWSGLRPRNNHVGHLIGVAELIDSDGVTLPGFTLQIEVKAPIDSPRCLFLLSIMKLQNRKRKRIYQLEVSPMNKRTHNGENIIYGPHEHVGDTVGTVSDVRCEDWKGVLNWFFTRTNITNFEIQDPHHVAM